MPQVRCVIPFSGNSSIVKVYRQHIGLLEINSTQWFYWHSMHQVSSLLPQAAFTMAAGMKQKQNPETFTGIVKMVMSGDTLIIREEPKGGPPPERLLSLHAVIAPRLARRPVTNDTTKNEKDEPYAWEAREFLRKKLVGKKVLYTIESATPIKNSSAVRQFGFVYLGEDMKNGETIVESLLSEGLATVRRDLSNSSSDLAKRLLKIQARAKDNMKGKWLNAGGRIRKVNWFVKDKTALLNKYQDGERIQAIVEQVRDGSTMRVFLLPEFNYVTVLLSGVKSPGYRFTGGKRTPEPYAEEAEYFTSSRLLQRDVEVVLEAVCVDNDAFVGSVYHPKGDIAEHLLLAGLAKCFKKSMPFVTGGEQKLRDAEKVAREKKLKIHS